MFVATSPSEAPTAALPTPQPLQRASGRARLSFKRDGRRSRLEELYQSGCARVLFPRSRGAPEAVLVNIAGGVTGGDRLDYGIACASGASAVVTTQACEKVYRALGEDARVATSIQLAEDADLAWLPQEAILFDGARLTRSITVEMAGSSRLLMVEAVLFGRQARGETVSLGALRDDWRVRRDGRLVFAEALRLEGPVQGILGEAAIGNGARALATVLLVAPDAEAFLEDARASLAAAEVESGASAWDGMLVARILSRDGAALRRALVRVLEVMRGADLPRVWSC